LELLERPGVEGKTIGDKKLNRIKTATLLDFALTGQQLAGAVEDPGDVAHTDGMIFGNKGTST
jgi:hypothetical protein